MLYLSLGTNLGNRHENIDRACALIGERIGTVVRKAIPIETAPVGFESDNLFVNTAVAVDTTMTPAEVLHATQQIEHDMGRTVKSKDGSIQSRIRPTLREGSVVTDTRCNVHYLVTEYGMVNLKGASTWERAERIISIAHPDFREALIRDAERMKIWRRSARR